MSKLEFTPFVIPDDLINHSYWISQEAIDRLRLMNEAVPPEISRITNGVIHKIIGFSVNDGLQTWYAFDLDRALHIAVLGEIKGSVVETNSYRKLSPARFNPTQFIRNVTLQEQIREEFVTLLPATQDRCRHFAELANNLAEPSKTFPPPMWNSGVESSFSAIRDGKNVKCDYGLENRHLMEKIKDFTTDVLQDAVMQAYE